MQSTNSLNHLSKENSLYLKQHAHNPVNWYPWGKAAFDAAQKDNKLIIISIGYSSCHWCHVMAHECFENKFIADLMNRYFVCIKVDREERPDIDQVYMTALQMIQQKGGWPLNVFCLPDGKPFFGGTYFPPEDKGFGIIPWPQLLMRITDNYSKDPSSFKENANNIFHNLNYIKNAIGDISSNSEIVDLELLLKTAHEIISQFDEVHGGFGTSPKFHNTLSLQFLLSLHLLLPKDNPHHQQFKTILEKTLTAMACGGIYDQIGGGFCRYSVDQKWEIPHFEKMLYDNGLLLQIYSKAYIIFNNNSLFKSIIEETIDFLLRDMRKDSLFYSSINADSEGVEGKFYSWTLNDIYSALDKTSAEKFIDTYGLNTTKGNFTQNEFIPTLTLLHLRDSLKDTRTLLHTFRNKRVHPTIDQKYIISWNCLVIQGLAEAGFLLNRKNWFTLAMELLDIIWSYTTASTTSKLVKIPSVIYSETNSLIPGMLNDYAYLAETYLKVASRADWIKPGSSTHYITKANQLIQSIIAYFQDPENPGFFLTPHFFSDNIIRYKEWLDNVTPCGHSSLLYSLEILSAIEYNPNYIELSKNLKKIYKNFLPQYTSSLSHALYSFTLTLHSIQSIHYKNIPDSESFFNHLRSPSYAHILIFDKSHDPSQPTGYQLCSIHGCSPIIHNSNELISTIYPIISR